MQIRSATAIAANTAIDESAFRLRHVRECVHRMRRVARLAAGIHHMWRSASGATPELCMCLKPRCREASVRARDQEVCLLVTFCAGAPPEVQARTASFPTDIAASAFRSNSTTRSAVTAQAGHRRLWCRTDSGNRRPCSPPAGSLTAEKFEIRHTAHSRLRTLSRTGRKTLNHFPQNRPRWRGSDLPPVSLR